VFCTSRRLICRKRTVTYHGHYLTTNSRISEYDHKCETRNAEPKIGTDGSSQTRRNPRVDRYGAGFGPPTVCGLGFRTVLEPNRPVFAVQTLTAGGLPGPVANTTDHHYHFLSLSLCLPCRQNQSGNICRGADIALLGPFWIPYAIVWLYIRFNVCHTIVSAVIWII